MSEAIDPERILFAPTLLKQPYNNVELGIIASDLFGVQRSVTKKNTTVNNLLHPKQLAVIERDNQLLAIAGATRAARRPVINADREQGIEIRTVKKRAPRGTVTPRTATATAPKPAGRGTKGKEPKKELKMVKLGSKQPGKK